MLTGSSVDVLLVELASQLQRVQRICAVAMRGSKLRLLLAGSLIKGSLVLVD